MTPKRAHEARAAAHTAKRAASLRAELAEVAQAEVGQLVMFPVAPDVFRWIEFRSVTGQPRDRERCRFVASKRTWGEERVTFVNRQGEARSVPVNWTDVALPEPYAIVGKGRVRVRVEDLLLLVDLIEAVKREER